MGEYLKFRGQSCKLGTCEDLYYIRHSDLTAIADECQSINGNDDARGYLNPGNGFRFRFPFPDEDNLGPFEYEQFDRGHFVPVPPDVFDISDVTHTRVFLKTDRGNFRISMPCPLAGYFAAPHIGELPHFNALPNVCHQDAPGVEIVQQRPIQTDGGGVDLWLITRCQFCGARWRWPPDDAARLAEHILKRFDVARNLELDPLDSSAKFWGEMAARIVAGYRVTQPIGETLEN